MSAIISGCGRYRYRLEREVSDTESGIVIAYFGVNPSTADADADDHTTRKLREFTRRHGGHRYILGNVLAYRSRDVKALAHRLDPIGPDNALHVAQIIRDADVLVPMWGARGKLPLEFRHLLDPFLRRLIGTGKPVRVFGQTASGDPKHPLVLRYDTPLVDWPIAR